MLYVTFLTELMQLSSQVAPGIAEGYGLRLFLGEYALESIMKTQHLGYVPSLSLAKECKQLGPRVDVGG